MSTQNNCPKLNVHSCFAELGPIAVTANSLAPSSLAKAEDIPRRSRCWEQVLVSQLFLVDFLTSSRGQWREVEGYVENTKHQVYLTKSNIRPSNLAKHV